MKIALVNTYRRNGGAAIACHRLYEALSKYTASEVSLSCMDQDTVLKKYLSLGRLAFEKLYFSFYEVSPEVRFRFSLANTGEDITRRPEIEQADIIHFHWTQQGFLSLKNMAQIRNLPKPAVWTLHDMWAFTGGCHYSGSCDHYMGSCGACFYLKNPSAKDLSFRIHLEKSRNPLFKDISIVTCSQWLAACAKKSSLFREHEVSVIPNPIDTSLYRPMNKAGLRYSYRIAPEKKIILFAAASIADERKGFNYLTEALQSLYRKAGQEVNDIELIVLGNVKKNGENMFPFKVHYAGYIEDEKKLAEYYALADIFVSPSLEDNLPNTIMEAMSCGTPVVAFDVGGIGDLIDHRKNGILAEARSSEALAEGISHVLNASGGCEDFGMNARQKVIHHFDSAIIARKYENLYREILTRHRSKPTFLRVQ
jgi:glycosyltransferase involved in cell wall biosynthesis